MDKSLAFIFMPHGVHTTKNFCSVAGIFSVRHPSIYETSPFPGHIMIITRQSEQPRLLHSTTSTAQCNDNTGPVMVKLCVV